MVYVAQNAALELLGIKVSEANAATIALNHFFNWFSEHLN
jgi:hypothetical protein